MKERGGLNTRPTWLVTGQTSYLAPSCPPPPLQGQGYSYTNQPGMDTPRHRVCPPSPSTHAIEAKVGTVANPGDGAMVCAPGKPRSPDDGAGDTTATGAPVCGIRTGAAGDGVASTGGVTAGAMVGRTSTGGATTGVGVGSTGRGVGGSTGIGAGVTVTGVTGAFVSRGAGGT